MRFLAPLTAAAAVVLALAGPARAQPKDAAELFPASTLAYLEVRQPERLSRELTALVKGSALDDLPATMSRAREKRGDNPNGFFFGDQIFSMISMLCAPETLAEYGRLAGGAVAITGWNREDGPEIVGVLYPGDCNLVLLYVKMFLAVDPNMRVIDKVEGVNLYRERGPVYNAGPFEKGGAPPPPPQIKEHGPVIGYMPGLVIIASTPAGAKEAVRRARGKVSEPALATLSAFKTATKLRDKPGLFAYADAAALTTRLEETAKGNPALLSEAALLNALLNPKGMGPAVASLTLQNGGLDLHMHVAVDPKQPCPLLELVPDKKALLEGLHFAPKDGTLTLTLAWPDGEKRWAKLVALIDTLAGLRGDAGPATPGKALAEMEKEAGINLGKDVFARVSGITLTVDTGGVNGLGIRQLALTATDAEAAKALHDLVPKVAGLAGLAAAPDLEKVQGHTIRTVGAEKTHFGKWCYSQDGPVLVLGHAKEAVAAALTGGGKEGGLLGETKVAAALKETDDALVVGVWSLGQSLVDVMKANDEAARQPRINRNTLPPGALPPPAPPAGPPVKDEEGEKLLKELVRAFDPLPPAVLTVTRKGDLFALDLKQIGLKTVSVKVLNALVDKGVHDMMSNRGRFGPGVVDDTLPPIPEKP